MTEQQIQEFFTKVANDESFKEEVLKFKEGMETKKLTEQDVQKFVGKVLLPKAKKLGYDFSEKDLADFGNSQGLANLDKLSLEDLENVSGGVNKGLLGAMFSLAMFMGVGAGAGMSASAVDPLQGQPGAKRAVSASTVARATGREAEPESGADDEHLKAPEEKRARIEPNGAQQSGVEVLVPTGIRSSRKVVKGVDVLSYSGWASDRRNFVGYFGDQCYDGKKVFMLYPGFDGHALKVPRGKRLQLLMYDTGTAALNVLRLGSNEHDTYFVVIGQTLWFSMQRPRNVQYSAEELNKGEDAFRKVTDYIVNRASKQKRPPVQGKKPPVNLETLNGNWSGDKGTRKIWDVKFNDNGSVDMIDSGSVHLLEGEEEDARDTKMAQEQAPPVQQPDQRVPQISQTLQFAPPVQQPGQPPVQHPWLDDILNPED